MGVTAAIVLITATLCVGGNDAAAGHLADAAGAPDGAPRAAQAKRARRRRAQTRRAPKKQRSADPSSQPAHMAPQLEDIPPVKPPATVPPKADKRNPV